MVAGRRVGLIGMLLILLCAGQSHAEIIQRIQSGIDGLARGMDYVGERAGRMLGPGVSLSPPDSTAFVAQRTFDEQYPLGPAPMVLLSNEFGEIRVGVWNERLVRINASIVVGADSQEAADQVAQLIEVGVAQGLDYLECRTRLPEIKGGGKVSMVVNYQLMVPQDAGLAVENFFGDVHVAGLGGSLVADVQYGGLELNQITGPVRAQVLGDFQVTASGLRQGGTFKLQNANGDFSDYQGELSVQHFRGAVTVRQPGPQSSLLLSSDSGRAKVILPLNSNPDLNATLSYGKLESALEVTRQMRGEQLLARHPNNAAEQRIVINAAFSDIAIEVEGKPSESAVPVASKFKAFTDVLAENFPVSEDNSMVITAIPGNIHVEGVDDDQVALSATRVVWAPSAAAGMDALEALTMEAGRDQETLVFKTSAGSDISAYGCESYRVDLNIQVPRTMVLKIQAAEGITTVLGVDGGGAIEQGKGEVVIENAGGPFTVKNHSGAISIKNCRGPADVTTRYGATTLEQVQADIRVDAEEGRTHIDAPGGNVYIRNRRGDVRLLSLEPVKGNYDILVEDGGLNAFIDPGSNASVTIKTVGGRVQSALPLSGSIQQDTQEFFGRIKEGKFTVRLESKNGDVLLN